MNGENGTFPMADDDLPEKRLLLTDWLPAPEAIRFRVRLDAVLTESGPGHQEPCFVCEPDPVEFLANVFAHLLRQRTVVIANPDWGPREWQAARDAIEPYRRSSRGEILIPTGGSSGRLRFVRHNWRTLTASAEGFANVFAARGLTHVCVLPLHHVSGLMQAIRAIVAGGRLVPFEWRRLKRGEPPRDLERYSVSLVPAQLQVLLHQPALHFWLQSAHYLFLGGAASAQPLLDRAAEIGLPVVLTYGATETAAMATAQKPGAFLDGDRTSGRPLPHIAIKVVDDDGQEAPAGKTGRIVLAGPSLFCGYIPENPACAAEWVSGDLGSIDNSGRLTVSGRADRMIITGGENVAPEEIERILLAASLVRDVYVAGVPDKKWGQALVGVYVPHPNSADVGEEMLRNAIRQQLTPWKTPKVWIRLNEIPRNAQGKIDPARMESILARHECQMD